MFRSGYRIATVWGIPIKVHISLVIVVLLFALRAGQIGGLGAMLDRILLAIGLITSVVLHELGHSYVAMKKGCRVREITLMFVGGAAQMEKIPRRPLDETLMALAGPAVSVVLGTICFFGGRQLIIMDIGFPGWIIYVLGWINWVLAGFNLLPSFPMDGGRVFRALLTPKVGRLRATFIAARLGKIMAVLFGLYGFLNEPRSWILVAIAFFIYSAAGREYRMVQMEEAARRGGQAGPFWNPFQQPPEPPPRLDSDADVVISPPPYAKHKRSEHAEVDVER